MLIKKELSGIPIGKMPESKDSYFSHVAAAQVVELSRSGKVLIVDFFNKKDKSLRYRFATDGKTYQTMNLLTGTAWTEQNPRAGIGYCAAEDTPNDVNLAGDFLNIDSRGRNHLSDMVDSFITGIRWNKRERAAQKKEDLRKTHFAMFPPLPENLGAYCDDHLFDAYLFISPLDKKGVRHARCSHCNSVYEVPKEVRSGQPASCPICGKKAVYRGTWFKSSLEDKTRICISAKVDGQILLRWTDVLREFSYPDFQPKHFYEDKAYNLFLQTPQGPKTYFYKWTICGHFYGCEDWYRGNIGDLCYDKTAVYTDNLVEVFGDRYCGVNMPKVLDQFHGMTPFAILLDDLKNIPATEYLLKMGMVNLASSVRYIPGIRNCLHPSFSGVLGVSAQLKDMYIQKDVTRSEHEVIKAYGKWISPDQLDAYRELGIEAHNPSTVADILQNMSFTRFINYFNKQKQISPTYSVSHILTCYRDYLNMSREMGVDLTHKSVRYPRDCVAAHKQIVARFNAIKKELEDNRFVEAVQSIYEGLRLRSFEKDGFCIMLPMKRSDLTTEGQSLNHCVGGETYYRNHIKGEKLIFFVREITNRQKPFFTMEVDMTDFRILQLYGFGDCTAPPAVRKFAEAFVNKLAPAKVLKQTA